MTDSVRLILAVVIAGGAAWVFPTRRVAFVGLGAFAMVLLLILVVAPWFIDWLDRRLTDAAAGRRAQATDVATPPEQRQWTVVLGIATTTEDGVPLSDWADWSDRHRATRRVWAVANAWTAQFEGLGFEAGGIGWVVQGGSGVFRPQAVDETGCFLEVVARETGVPVPDEATLAAAIEAAIIEVVGVDERRRLIFEGRTFFGKIVPKADAFWDVDALMSGGRR